MVLACIEKIRRLCGTDSDEDGGAGLELEWKEDLSGGDWITSGTTCRRENCQGRMHKTELNVDIS